MTERYLDIEPGTGQHWVWIERTADPDDDRGPDLYLGPFPKDSEHLALVCMNESALVDSELQPPRGGTDCQVVTEDPDPSTGGVLLIDHNDPSHTGIDSTTECRHCGHSIVSLAYRADETWIAPDAGYDNETGDGIWRETCPDNHEDRIAAHEPVWATDLPTCPRHGGAWGNDQTCEHCTYESGEPRRLTDPGPLGDGATS